MADDILKALSDSYSNASSNMDSDKKNVNEAVGKTVATKRMKEYAQELENIKKVRNAEADRYKELYKAELNAGKYSQKVKADLLKQEISHYTSLYNLNKELHTEQTKILEAERDVYAGITEKGKITLHNQFELYSLKIKEQNLEKQTIEYRIKQFEKRVDSVKKGLSTVINHIFKDLNELSNIYLFNNWKKGISDLQTQYETNFTEISGRLGIINGIDTHNLIGNVLNDIKSNDNYMKGLNFNNEVFPQITDAVKRGFQGEKAEEIGLTTAIDKKIMPWLDTTSDTWTQLQYNISDNMLQSIKGQQIQLQATQEGNRILQNGVVSALLDDLAPTLQAIDANTVSEDSMGSAYKAVETLIERGMDKTSAVKFVRDAISADQKPYQSLSSNDSGKILMGIGALQGGIAGAVNFYSNTVGNILAGTAGNRVATGAVDSVFGNYLPAHYGNYATMFDNLNIPYNTYSDKSNIYNDKVNNLTEYVTATQKNDNEEQNKAVINVFNDAFGNHILDIDKMILDEIINIKTWLITGLIAGLATSTGNKLIDKIISALGKTPAGGAGGNKVPAGGAGLGGLFTPMAGTGAGGLTSAMSIPAVGLAGGAIGAGLATYGYSNMSDYNKENRTGLAFSSGTGATLGAAGGAMLAGGAIAGMAGVGVANAWNPIGWGLLIGSAITLVATEIYDAATTIGGSARQVEAEYEAEKERINKQFRDQRDTLETIQSNLENNEDLETQRTLLINSGILSEHDIEIARNAQKDSLEKLTTAYLTATGKISPEIENDLDKYEQSDKAMAEDLQKNFRSVANKYLDDGKLTDGSNELKAVDTMLYTIYKDLDANSGKYDSWTEETQDLYDNLVKAYKDGKLTSKEVNWVIDEGWRNQSFVEANISADALNAGYKKIMTNDSTSSFGNEMGISGTFHGTERAMEAVTLANQALLQTSKEGAKEYLDKAKAKGYKSSEFSEIKEAADKWGLTGYKLGSSYIPYDMIAQLHAGERVLTANQNKEYTKELETGNGSIIVNSIQDVVSAIQNQTKTIIDYLSTMNFNNSSGFKKMSMLPSMGNTKVTL